ncbi:hypothetical protein C8Q78DRAFT_392214 [Trametes maxima]|nr:hypothetical protein C8Q78DRAFT_392214 [Trametes maxima]
MNRADFQDMPEIEVEKIVAQKWRQGKNGRRIALYRTRYVGMDDSEDEWLTRQELRNAPDILAEWQAQGKLKAQGDGPRGNSQSVKTGTPDEPRRLNVHVTHDVTPPKPPTSC